jgi:MoaA/NifB/PqqE/SkfB family radical SAM enzyme
MVDSNGLTAKRLTQIAPEKLYYISVSVDGATPTTHDRTRGHGTFRRTIATIRELVGLGYRVRINCTVSRANLHEGPAVLALADDLGVLLVNFHVLSEEGHGGRHPEMFLKPEEWIAFYSELEHVRDHYRTAVWYPPTWATAETLSRYVAEGFRGCLGCALDRLSIFPDGRCYVCSVLFDEARHFATITAEGLVLNRESNEADMFFQAAFQAPEPWLSGCPAEAVLERRGKAVTPKDLVSVCRCWKTQL